MPKSYAKWKPVLKVFEPLPETKHTYEGTSRVSWYPAHNGRCSCVLYPCTKLFCVSNRSFVGSVLIGNPQGKCFCCDSCTKIRVVIYIDEDILQVQKRFYMFLCGMWSFLHHTSKETSSNKPYFIKGILNVHRDICRKSKHGPWPHVHAVKKCVVPSSLLKFRVFMWKCLFT